MIQLVSMTESEFELFIEISMLDQAKGQIQAGYLHPKNAEETLERQSQQILPQGLETPNHYFFTLEEQGGSGIWCKNVMGKSRSL